MIKVITYGTYDMLHYGHIRLLERAKSLGDYLIVGITSDDFDKTRGKINSQQTLIERIEAIQATGLADEIIVEEYEGQKIDDIKKHNVDIFTVGSDWKGTFDYLGDYCKVVYLERTAGVSSTVIRSKQSSLRLGLIGNAPFLEKVLNESMHVNGIEINGICTDDINLLVPALKRIPYITDRIEDLLERVDAVYVHSYPAIHYSQIKLALQSGKHVLAESPLALGKRQCEELFEVSQNKGVVLMEAIRTAYSTAYQRMLLLIKAGRIGQVMSVDATCTSLKTITENNSSWFEKKWNSISAWGPTALLPVFQILGTNYVDKRIVSCIEGSENFDIFSKVDFIFSDATATIKVGRGVKSEGELIVSGTKGYIFVPAPWWKTDYFEIRYENPSENKRFFYQLDGEGIRYELVTFSKAIQSKSNSKIISSDISVAISKIMDDFHSNNQLHLINKR